MNPECLTFTGQWRALPGVSHGLRQAILLGDLQVNTSVRPKLSVLYKVIEAVLDEAIPDHLPALGDANALIQRILHIQALIQRKQQIPVLSTGRIFARGGAAQTGIQNYSVAIPYFLPEATTSTLHWIGQSVNQLAAHGGLTEKVHDGIHTSFKELLSGLRQFAVKGTNTYHFLCAAFDCGIPSSRVANNVFAFGEGARCRWLESTLTDETTAIGVQLAGSKQASAHVLRQYGLPTPRHQIVANVKQALLVAEKLGYPVVIKPDDQEQGRGVAAGLRNAESIGEAFLEARKFSRKILVESFHAGQDYRLTTFQGKVVKILHRRAGGVIGNGKDTIAELVLKEQQTEKSKRIFRQSGRIRLTLDAEALGLIDEQGLTPDAVPEPDRFVPLRRKSNISAGGEFTLIPLQECHPDNHVLAIRAADALRLNPCGVDLIIPDISRSWLETGAAIIEMNAKPQLGFSQGPEIYPQMLREMIEGNGTIPKHLLICFPSIEMPSVSSLTALVTVASCEGLSMSRGVWIKGNRTAATIGNGFQAARVMLRDKSIHSAFCVMSSQEVIENGLPAEYFDRITCLLPITPTKSSARLQDEIRVLVGAHTHRLEFLQDITELKS